MAADRELGYRLIDVDNHYYETEDCFTRHLEPGFESTAVRVIDNPLRPTEGMVLIGNEPVLGKENFTPRHVTPAGTIVKYFKDPPKADGFTLGGLGQTHLLPADEYPWTRDRNLRLKKMDDQGVDAAILLPTAANFIEQDMRRLRLPAPAFYANIRAFNRWLEEDWGYHYADRIFAPPHLSLYDRDFAIAELDRLRDAGARLFNIHAMPGGGDRSPADPYFDPFWARVEEAGLIVTCHTGGVHPAYMDLTARWGEDPTLSILTATAFQRFMGWGDRHVMDFFASLVLSDFFDRFPGLKFMSIENGWSDWVPYLITQVDHVYRQAYNMAWRTGRPPEFPSEIFRRHVWVNWFIEEDPYGLIDLIGIEHTVMGSDFPHPEGPEEPAEYIATLDKLSDTEKRKILRDNAGGLLGLSASVAA